MKNTFLLFFFLFFALNFSWTQGFTVSGTQLIDADGNNFVMKGINVPLAWFVSDVNNNIANIKNNTGSNCLRIVVTTSTTDEAWQTCVEKTIENKMIPMVELHDVTCNTSSDRILEMANFWAGKAEYLTRPEIAKYILINIANEWGDWNMANSNQSAWLNAYKPAVTAIRNAGINTTIVIDAPGCGQDIRNGETLRNYADDLITHDPQHNLLFSVHMYCEWATTSSTSNIATGLSLIKNAGVPIIVGEFGYQHDNNQSGVCDIAETTILNTCQTNGIGWLAWSWKGNGSPVQYLDLSNDWAGTNLSDWGETIVNGTNGTKTAVTAGVFNEVSSSASSLITPIAVYPNPVQTGSFTINSGDHSGETLRIYDIQDKLVFSKKIEGDTEFVASNLTPGLYILKVNDMVQKLVIE